MVIIEVGNLYAVTKEVTVRIIGKLPNAEDRFAYVGIVMSSGFSCVEMYDSYGNAKNGRVDINKQLEVVA